MSRKLIVMAWFGPLPAWSDRWLARAEALTDHGFDFLVDTDLPRFRQRVEDVLGVRCALNAGSAKIHDLRPCFGELYRDELAGYGWWGHTDMDVVFGRVDRFATDVLLDGCDVQTDNVYDYLCGPWTLYRNTDDIAALFRQQPDWRDIVQTEHVSGWVETSFTEIVRRACRLERGYDHAYLRPDLLADGDDGALLHGDREVSFFHFRRSKEWPQAVA